ncbi:MAG TPA: hypothetical protein VH186_02470 [Chloroflexia bacterium]|nr:hypothetical protein [Chloroflexia bacterium]
MPAAAILPVWLSIPALAFILLIPGFLTLHLVLSFGGSGQKSKALAFREKAFWTLSLGVFEAGWVALVLAEIGIFSAWLTLLILALWSLLALGWLWQRGCRGAWWREQFTWRPRFDRTYLDGWLLAALMLFTTVLFYLAPHQTLAGSQDSGVYFITGANIARTGAINIDDPLLKMIGDTSKDPTFSAKPGDVIPQFVPGIAKQEDRYAFAKLLRLPGFYVRDNYDGLFNGTVVPQFFHLYPAFLAVGYGFDGLSGETLVTPLLGILAVFAVYLTAWRLFPGRRERWIALLAGLLLSLNSVQVWFSRQSLWEMLGMLLLFTGIYAFVLMLRPVPVGLTEAGDADEATVEQAKDKSAAILGAFGAGVAFGLICLAHAQFPFLIWPLIPYFVWMRLTRRWGAAQWWLLITFGLLLFHAAIHIRLFSIAYFEGIYHNKLRDYLAILHFIIPPAAAGFILLVIIDAMPNRVRAFEGWVKRRWKYLSWGLAGLTLLYLVYNYFIRVYDISTDGQGNYPPRFWSLSSYIGAPTTEGPERSLVRLGWYFSPLGMLLVFLGLTWLLARRLNARTGFFLVLLAGMTAIFLDTNYTQELYIYSLRRYVVATVPAFTIVIAYALLDTIPSGFGWLGRLRLLNRFSRRQVLYAQAAGPGGSNMAMSVTQPLEQKPAHAPDTSGLVTTGGGYFWGRIAGLALAAGLVLFLFWTSRTVYTLPEYGPGDGQPGIITELSDLAGRFGPKDILLYAGDRDVDGKLATPLTYAFGVPGFVLTDALKNDETAGMIRRWEAQGYHVKALLGPNGGRFSPPGYDLKLEGSFTLKLRQLEELATQKPYNVQMNNLSWTIYDVEKSGANPTFASSAGTGNPSEAKGWNLKIGQNDDATLIEGFYGVEQDPNGAQYRWTALNGVMRMPCMAPEGGSGKISVTLAGGVRPAGKPLPQVKIYVSNYRYSTDKRLLLGTATLKPEAQTFTFDLPAGAPALSCARAETGGSTNSLILWLDGQPGAVFVPAKSGISLDPRQLSFKVYGLNLTSR